MQLATAGVAACIADMITFPLDTTKVMDIHIVIVVSIVNQTIIYVTIVVVNQNIIGVTIVVVNQNIIVVTIVVVNQNIVVVNHQSNNVQVRLQVQGELSSNNGAGAQPRGVVRFLLISSL